MCLGSGFGCAPPLLAGVLGRVCARVRAPLAPRHSWLGCAVWVCVFGLGFRLRPATPGWGVWVCVFVCLLPLYPATPRRGARPGCVCLGWGFGCNPPLLAGVLGCACLCVCPPLTPPLLAGVCGRGVCVWAQVLAAPRHSWQGCWAVCLLVWALHLHPATLGWGARRGCVCLGSGLGCTPPLLAGVLGCVCAGVGAPTAPRHSWLGCEPWVCVFGVGFRLRPATPGGGVRLCVSWCGRSACTPSLLAGVRAVAACVWARVSAAPRHSWLGCWAVCVLVWALRLHPATPGWGARRGCVCLGSGFGCALPLPAGVLGCVCAHVRAPFVPRHSWLGCVVWVCVFGLGFRLRPATPGWAVRCGCVCSGLDFGCAPPLLAGVCGVWVGCCLAPVCVPWFVVCCARSQGLWHPAAVAAWHLSVCLGCGRQRASLACPVALRGAPRLFRSGRSRCSGRLSRRCGAFPHPGGLCPRLYWAAARGTRRPAENRALCACCWPRARRGRWTRSASYPFGAPRWGCPWRVPPALVLGCVRCGGWRVWTRSLTRPVSRTVRRSTVDSAPAPGLFRVDADTASCGSEDATPGSRACVRVLALSGRVGRAGLPGAFWCASPFPFAALAFCFAWPPPGWACPRLGRFFFPLPSSARPLCLLLSLVSGPGCPGPWRCVLFVLLASRFSALHALSLLLCCPPGCWLLPGGCSPPPPLCVSRFFLPPLRSLYFFFLVHAPVVSRHLWFPAPAALGLGAVLCVFFPPASRLSVRSRFFFPAWPLAASWCLVPPPPPPFHLCLAGFVAAARCPPPFFFLPCVCPHCLWLSLVSGPGCPGPWRCVLFALWASRFSALCVLSPFSVSCLAVGCSLVVAAPPPPPPAAWCFVLFFFALCAPVVSGFLWFPAPGAFEALGSAHLSRALRPCPRTK